MRKKIATPRSSPTLGPASSSETDYPHRCFETRLLTCSGSIFSHRPRPTSTGRACEMAAPESVREFGRPVGILADLQGPKLRVGRFAGGAGRAAARGAVPAGLESSRRRTPGRVNLPHPGDLRGPLRRDATLLLDDGRLQLKVEVVSGGNHAVTRVMVGPGA